MAAVKWGALGAVTLLVAAALVVLASDLQAQPRPELDARIEIVWPQNGVDVLAVDKANITVYLFARDTLRAFCDTDVAVMLMIAKSNEGVGYYPAAGAANWRRTTQENISFFAWDFNDVDVSFARNPDQRLYFLIRDFVIKPTPKVSTPLNVESNVWAHGADALTFSPIQEVPTGNYPAPSPGVVRLAPKIQIVWPHGGLPVTQADKVNVTATIFHREALASMSVPPEHDWLVQLYQALNQEPLRPVSTGQKRVVTANGVTYPVWDFNNIDVSAAKDPRNKYFFQVKTSGSEGSNIWAHGADGRTFFPQQDVPSAGCP